VTIHNEGDRTIPDLRVIDSVPGDVAVVGDSPGACVALRPDERVTVAYDVLPPRGTHDFGDVVVRGRSLAGTVVGTATLSPSGATSITCETLLDEVPLREQTTQFVGRRPTATGGAGVEFHSVREYRRGDPLSHVDWRRLARDGDLATVSYREERAASVVFVVDDRPAAAVQPPAGGPSATDLAVYAASRGLVALTDAGHRVGVTTIDSDGEWVSPGRGPETETAAAALLSAVRADESDDDPLAGMAKTARSVLATDGAGRSAGGHGDRRAATDGAPTETSGADTGGEDSREEPDATDATSGHQSVGSADGRALAVRLANRLPANAQVVICSSLVDDVPVAAAESLLASGHEVTVLSPAVAARAAAASPGQSVAALSRATRLTALGRLGVPAIDWDAETPLQVALGGVLDAQFRGWTE
jgi:uncharacterized protein (DUF58 family)